MNRLTVKTRWGILGERGGGLGIPGPRDPPLSNFYRSHPMKTSLAACIGINLTVWAIVAHLNLCPNNTHDFLYNPTTAEASYATMQEDHDGCPDHLDCVDPLCAR